jgi:hypothetical protein
MQHAGRARDTIWGSCLEPLAEDTEMNGARGRSSSLGARGDERAEKSATVLPLAPSWGQRGSVAWPRSGPSK